MKKILILLMVFLNLFLYGAACQSKKTILECLLPLLQCSWDSSKNPSCIPWTNTPPTASNMSATTNEDTPINASLSSATDVDGDPITYSLNTGATNGTASVTSDGHYSYTPNPNFNGTDSFRYTVADNHGGSNTYTVTITVNPVNDAPTITEPNSGNTYIASIPENTTAVTDVNATDPDGNTLTYSLSGTDAAKFTIDPATGVVTFTTAPDYENPTDSGANNVYDFTVTVSDNGSPGLSATQAFTITVANVDEPPIADYHLDECVWNGVAGEVKDSSPSGLHAIAINGATIDTGKVCKSGKFDGTNDYVDVGNVLNPL
ncbi:MAG: Ig-like domain-containing protein, partial [Sulfuricurvum sp.]|nr:Ig-like domain-containing protein [Sulfuricurvum sp.]